VEIFIFIRVRVRAAYLNSVYSDNELGGKIGLKAIMLLEAK